jgi:hypothetical protein
MRRMAAELRRSLDRGLYLALSLWMWVIVAVGFSPGYFGPLLDRSLDKTGAVHFHVVVYIGWLVLFTVQSILPMTRRTRLHRKIGRFGIGYGVLVFATGLFVTFSRFADRVEAGHLDEARMRALAPFSDMIVFPILFGLAIGYRRQPELHKRFMVLAGTMLLIAAVARMSFLGDPPAPLVLIAVWLSPVWIAMLHDAYFRRRLHPVYAFGFVALSIMPFRSLLIDTSFWRATTERLAAAIS